MQIGNNLRRIRKRQNLSLQELADLCKVSKSTLSNIERMEKSPTVQTVKKIAIALNVTLFELMDQSQEKKRCIVTRNEDCKKYVLPGNEMEKQLVSPASLQYKFAYVLTTIPTGQASFPSPPHVQRASEFIFVTQGILQIIINNATTYDLTKGESIFFDGSIEYQLKNIGDEPLQFHMVMFKT